MRSVEFFCDIGNDNSTHNSQATLGDWRKSHVLDANVGVVAGMTVATGRAFSTLTSVCEHAYTCLHVSTETYQLIWMPASTLDIYSC
jgi:hypothetical protein